MFEICDLHIVLMRLILKASDRDAHVVRAPSVLAPLHPRGAPRRAPLHPRLARVREGGRLLHLSFNGWQLVEAYHHGA